MPPDRTAVERALSLVGWAGAGLGLAVVAFALLSVALFPRMTLSYLVVGACGVAAGLGLAGASQLLATLRAMAARPASHTFD